jgi:hypothetical protein
LLCREPLPRVTLHDVPVTPCEPKPLSNVPDGRPAEPVEAEPVNTTASAPAESTAAAATVAPGAHAEATDVMATAPATSTAAPAERFDPSAFMRDAQGQVHCPAGHRMHRVEVRQRSDGPRERYVAPRAACEACALAPSCRGTSRPTSKGRIVDLPLASARVVPAPSSPPANAEHRPPPPGASPTPATATVRPRFLPVWQHPVPYWTDLPASTMRRALHDTLDRQHVDITAPASEPARPAAQRVVGRDQRAHRRRTWDERLTRNARPRNAPPITIHVSGVPPKLARAVGLTSSAVQPLDRLEGSRGMDATT